MQKVTWEKRRCIPFPSSWIFFFRGYFWPAPDTGNCPVQLKCLQMTLSVAIIHTSLSSWLSLVKYIFPFIGSFLSSLSQGPCCLTTGQEREREREINGERERESERESMVGTMPAMKEWEKLNRSRKGKGEKQGQKILNTHWLFLFGINASFVWEGEQNNEGRVKDMQWSYVQCCALNNLSKREEKKCKKFS